MAEASTFQIPKDVIEPIIQAHVSAAVTAALADRSRLMEEAVSQVLNMKVDSQGRPENYSSSIPWIQWVMKECLKKAVRGAIEAELGKQESQIKAHIVTELQRKNSPMIKQLVAGMITAITHPDNLRYRLNITVDGKE